MHVNSLLRFYTYIGCIAYSYANHKTGRGPRFIVLAAVCEDGVIPGSVLMYKPTSELTADDYHNNVGKEKFTKWFNKLAKILQERGGECIFVKESASTQSSKQHPTNPTKNK